MDYFFASMLGQVVRSIFIFFLQTWSLLSCELPASYHYGPWAGGGVIVAVRTPGVPLAAAGAWGKTRNTARHSATPTHAAAAPSPAHSSPATGREAEPL